MKPNRGRVFCRECHRQKLLFDSEKKAELFIKFNAEETAECNGYAPVRSYYCMCCGGWHVTHKPFNSEMKSVSERIVEDYNRALIKKKLAQQSVAIKRNKVHKMNLEKISEINSMIEKIKKCVETELYDEAKFTLLKAYEILQSVWTTVGDKSAKKRIHRALDNLSDFLKTEPVKIHG